MAAGNLDIYIEQGSTFRKKLTLKDSDNVEIDLTDYEFAGQIRKRAGHADIIAEFSFEKLNQMTNPGEVYMILTSTQTSAIVCAKSTSATKKTTSYAYDVEYVDGDDNTVRLLEGLAEISPEITIEE